MLFAVGDFLCVPYRPFAGPLSKNDTMFEACLAHPERFTLPMTRGEIRATVASVVTNPENAVWEVWRGSAFVGILLLDRIVPGLDARWHFVFFDDELLGKLALLKEFARRCFADWHFERLTFEVPEHLAVLTSFARRKLGFRYEGERPGLRKQAALGSRRERAYFDGTTWRDVVVMRLLKEDACAD